MEQQMNFQPPEEDDPRDDDQRELAPTRETAPALSEPAPPNNLPAYAECALRVANSDFIAKRVSEGGYGAEADSKLATELHRFICEYDDADAYRSEWFLHRLERLLDETKAEALVIKADREQRPAAEPHEPLWFGNGNVNHAAVDRLGAWQKANRASGADREQRPAALSEASVRCPNGTTEHHYVKGKCQYCEMPSPEVIEADIAENADYLVDGPL